eukprot:Phypoly_transcript_15687.p2 GENE.Phypoly_transcript_15687~~Phypoly_transcript_15687.p2  ORF type:complete len:115 (-),score=20.08 Phypoly_transcript_15687:1-345(-)
MADQDILIMMVGNKCDLEQQREVATQEATAFAEANKISFLETSALNGQNVTQAFENLLSDIYNMVSKKKPLIDDGQWLEQPHQPSHTERIVPVEEKVTPTNGGAPQEKKGGCGC